MLRANDLVVWDAHKDLEAKSWTVDGAEMTKCRRRPDQERLPLWFAAAALAVGEDAHDMGAAFDFLV